MKVLLSPLWEESSDRCLWDDTSHRNECNGSLTGMIIGDHMSGEAAGHGTYAARGRTKRYEAVLEFLIQAAIMVQCAKDALVDPRTAEPSSGAASGPSGDPHTTDEACFVL